jgi:hypothetical protein
MKFCKTCGEKHRSPTGKNCTRLADLSDDEYGLNIDSTRSDKHQQDPIDQSVSHVGDFQKETMIAIEQMKLSMKELSQMVQGVKPRQAPEATAADSDHLSGHESSDAGNAMASAVSLQQNDNLQAKVNDRMTELSLIQHNKLPDTFAICSQTSKGKVLQSGRSRTTRDIVVRDVTWPHFHVHRGHSRRPVNYEDLTLPEFAFGYVQTIVDQYEKAKSIDTFMLQINYLRDVFRDCMDNPWEIVKNFNGIFFQYLEMDRIDWGDKEKIAYLRAMYVTGPRRPRPDQRGPDPQRQQAQQGSAGNGLGVCQDFARGECNSASPHDCHGTSVRHICGYCMNMTGRAYDHTERNCIRKGKNMNMSVSRNNENRQ